MGTHTGCASPVDDKHKESSSCSFELANALWNIAETTFFHQPSFLYMQASRGSCLAAGLCESPGPTFLFLEMAIDILGNFSEQDSGLREASDDEQGLFRHSRRKPRSKSKQRIGVSSFAMRLSDLPFFYINQRSVRSWSTQRTPIMSILGSRCSSLNKLNSHVQKTSVRVPLCRQWGAWHVSSGILCSFICASSEMHMCEYRMSHPS